MGTLRFVILSIVAIWLGCGPALAGKRIALVIGNSDYKNVPKLANPLNDAALLSDMFEKAGFESVDTRLNLDIAGMRKVLREFGAKAHDADVAVIYYAGHGVELDGNNYLIPTDATLETDSDVLDETLPVDRVLFAVEPAKQLRLVILDACRENPFAKTMKRTVAARAVGRGLARVEPSGPNTMIAFAAKAGSTASDGDSKYSPFATALAEHLPKPGIDLRKAFGFVRDDVLKNTGYRQEPYVYGSLGGGDLPLVPAAPAAAPRPDPDGDIRRDYEFALQVATREGWSAFLARYPEGFYASLAKSQLSKIEAGDSERARQADTAKAAAVELARTTTEKTASPDAAKVATLSPSSDAKPTPPDLAKAEQAELRRVGCLTATADGNWNEASQRALTLFDKYTGATFDAKLASADALDLIKSKPGRVCPLVCNHGFNAEGDACVKITCRAGYRVGDDNSCEKVQQQRPVAERQDSRKRSEERKQTEASPSKPQASGQLVCGPAGCHPIKAGCHIEKNRYSADSSWFIEKCP